MHFPYSASHVKSHGLFSILLLALFFLSASPWRVAAGGKDEKEKITALIAHIESLKDASFIRNGRSYDAAAAGKFLRRKWEANAGEIKSAAGFIEKIASASGTSGQPYLIHFKDGKETKCGDYLKAQLGKMEKPKK